MTNSMKLDRRQFGKFLGLASAAGAAAMTGQPARAQQKADWKAWVDKFYKKPIKMAVTCPGTSNPYFAPTKAGAEDAGAQLGIDMLWTGVPDGNTVNQLAQFQQLVNTGYRGDRRDLVRTRRLDRANQEGDGGRRAGADLQQRLA